VRDEDRAKPSLFKGVSMPRKKKILVAEDEPDIRGLIAYSLRFAGYEVIEAMDDLLNVGVKVFTIGQYLQPSKQHYPVKEYIKPEIFSLFEMLGRTYRRLCI
jgi:hypothetical protein